MKIDLLEHKLEEEEDELGGIDMPNFDVIAKIRNLFSFGGRGDNSISKKRKSEEGNIEYKTLTKYRRIDSEFPKVINKPFEDDISFMKKINKTIHKKMGNRRLPLKSQRKSIDLLEYGMSSKPKMRTDFIKTSFADCEFSDDEDEDIILNDSGIPIARGVYNVETKTFHTNNKNDNLEQLKTLPRNKFKGSNFGKPLPPLIQPKSGGILASSIIPKLQPIRKQTNKYESLNGAGMRNGISQNNIPRLTPIFNGGHRLSSSNRHNKNSYFLPQQNSILQQEYQIKDKRDYLELLCAIEPGIYKSQKPKNVKLRQNTPEYINLNNVTNKSKTSSPIKISDDDEDTEAADFNDDDFKLSSVFDKMQKEADLTKNYKSPQLPVKKPKELPFVDPINSFKEKLDLLPINKPEWMKNFKAKHNKTNLERQIREAEEESRKRAAETSKIEKETQEKLKTLNLFDKDLVVLDEFPEPVEDEEVEFPDLDDEFLKKTLYTRADQVLVSKFNINITRRDIESLIGSNWLNDEVINFYMNLLTERGEQKNADGYPKVYAMNTFFIPRLMQSGHGGVKRWTRKVDIFSYDVLPVPVHVGGVHWCMAIIHLKNKTIRYYDSMGQPNGKVLNALEIYLQDESMDKRKQRLDTSEFTIENISDCPRQNNGSDCGVFSCMFAEYITRNKSITFSQQNMEYFRRKMVFEICKGKLLL